MEYAAYFDQDLIRLDLDGRHFVELRRQVPRKVTRVLLADLRRAGALNADGVRQDLTPEQGEALDRYNAGIVVAFIAGWNYEGPAGATLPLDVDSLDEIPETHASRIMAEVQKLRAGRTPEQEAEFPGPAERVDEGVGQSATGDLDSAAPTHAVA